MENLSTRKEGIEGIVKSYKVVDEFHEMFGGLLDKSKVVNMGEVLRSLSNQYSPSELCEILVDCKSTEFARAKK